VLVVIQAKQTPIPQVRRTLATLDQVNAPVLGLVFNKASEKGEGLYSYGYGYTGYSRREAVPR
jgi:Mrp family chromosome partitioning ATPase